MNRALVLGLLTSTGLGATASSALAAPGESSFTPDSLLVPLQGVGLASTAGYQNSPFYQCGGFPQPPAPDAGSGNADAGAPDASLRAGSEAGLDGGTSSSADGGPTGDPCLVDMADAHALSSLFTDEISVQPGTYDSVAFFHCVPGAQGYTVYVRGTAVLGGVPYYTTTPAAPGDAMLTTDPSRKGYVPLDFQGCASSVALPSAITLAASDEVTVSAFFSLKNISWAATNGMSRIGGCNMTGASGQSVCASYPIPVAFLGTTSPALETYYVTEDLTDLTASKAGGQMLILRDGDKHPFGGFSRRLYSEASVQPPVNYDTPIRHITPNEAGDSYFVETYGGGGPNGPVDFYLRFPAFELQSHEGTITRNDGSEPLPYRAVLQSQ